MSSLKWDRPKFQTEGRETENVRGYGDAVPAGRRKRRRPKRRKTMLSDGTTVDGALSSADVMALESEREDGEG